MANVYKLHSANIYLNDKDYAHVASEVTLPEIKRRTVKHEPVSSQMAAEIPLSMEPMNVTIKGDFDPAFVAAASNHKDIQLLHIYSDLVEMDDVKGRVREMQVVATMRVLFTGVKPGSHKQGEAVEMEYFASVWVYKLEVEGVPIYDNAVASNKAQVLGVNLHGTTNKLLNI